MERNAIETTNNSTNKHIINVKLTNCIVPISSSATMTSEPSSWTSEKTNNSLLSIYLYDTVSTQTWIILYTGLFLQLSFSKRGGVHDKLHISSAD